ncbi:MAG: hypothetical protein EAX90_15510, partial [Candidatus Heimdallarchaeota archaeon]|nr:hypothetical protein [Candidatus Heimdallarchaeota archaeon]
NIIETAKKSGQEYFKGISTFSKEFSTREFDAYYQPKKIIILCSPRTFSSGFDLMMELYWVGGKIIGINTGQSVNYYGNILEVKLTNSKIPFGISTKYFEYFPDRKSDSFGPDYPLTYDKLAYYNFDENAILLYALDLISNNEI